MISPLLYWFQPTEAANLDAHNSTNWSTEVDATIMHNYHWERAALIDFCSRRLSAVPPEEQDENMDDGAGGPEDVEW